MKFVFSVVSAKSKLSCRADCGLTGSWQIMAGTVFNGLESAAHCKRRFSLFLSFFESGRRSFYVFGGLLLLCGM